MKLLDLYRDMARVRAYEVAIAELWQQGQISGEMHLGTGEEAVNVGVAAHLRHDDAVALDHRNTPMMLLRGTEPVPLLRELMGKENGLCRGWGGHMHLFDRERLAASSGIVGAAGPLATGFALAAKRLREGTVAVAFFGDGAVNQGQLMESFNLAVAWQLPVLFVCKNNEWAITTRTGQVTGGDLATRARGFGLRLFETDGLDAEAVYKAAGRALHETRTGKGPAFLLTTVSRLDGHYLGDLLVRMADHPIGEGAETFQKAIGAALAPRGGGIGARMRSMAGMMTTLNAARRDKRDGKRDPLVRARRALSRQSREAARIDEEIASEVQANLEAAMGEE
jgi:pyruvate dehydrogenase E1 component alpha subunit